MNYKKTIFGCLLTAVLAIPAIQAWQSELPGGVESGYNRYPSRYGNPNPVRQVQPGYYLHYPTDRKELYQQAVPASPEIVRMNAYVQDALRELNSMDILRMSDRMAEGSFVSRKANIQHLGDRFIQEYGVFVDMLQRNDPALRHQERVVRKAYRSFKSEFESFRRSTR